MQNVGVHPQWLVEDAQSSANIGASSVTIVYKVSHQRQLNFHSISHSTHNMQTLG